jgi:hypothetical protein
MALELLDNLRQQQSGPFVDFDAFLIFPLLSVTACRACLHHKAVGRTKACARGCMITF